MAVGLLSWDGVAHAASPSEAELRVEKITVDLTIYPGGTDTPDGIRVARRSGYVDGVAEYRLNRPAKPTERLTLLNEAQVLRRDSPELRAVDEVVLETHLDGPFQSGKLDVTRAEGVKGVVRTGERRDVEVEVLPGAQTIRLYYRVKVPRRYWPFGCAKRRCSLAGAIAPLPSEPVDGGVYADPGGRVVQPVHWQVRRVRFGQAPAWVPGTKPPPNTPRNLRDQEIVVADQPPAGDGAQAYPSIFWGPKWRRVTDIHHGVEVEVLHMFWRPGDQVPAERKLQLYRDVPGHLIKAAREVVDVVADRGHPLAPGTRIQLVQGPLRANIAHAHPSAITVSDQILQLFPGRRFMGFHRAAVARAMLDSIALGTLVNRHDPSTDFWLAGTVAMDWLDLWSFRSQQSDEYARDILGKFAFVPAVDNFLYTGQAAFSQAYFRGSEDEHPLRRHPLLFAHDLPTGRRIHEKLRDLLGPQRLAAFHEALRNNLDANPRALAEQIYGHKLGWFFDQWLGPYPAVDYSLEAVETTRTKGIFHHEIKVLRASEKPLVEPVQVLAIEKSGKAHYLLWNGDDPSRPTKLGDVPLNSRHTWSLETKTQLKSVHVDPRRRGFEQAFNPDNVDPLFNNRSPAGTRFLYTGFGLNIAATEFLNAQTASARLSALSFYAFFEASRRRDLRATGLFQLYSDRTTLFGFGAGANIWFGPKVNRQRRRSRLRLFADFGILDGSGLDSEGGVRLGQTLAWIHDSRRFTRWPDRGRRLALSLRSTEVLRTEPGVVDHRYALNAKATWVELWPLAHQHVLVSQVEGSLVTPIASEVEYRSLVRAGGIGDLSGYGGNELLSRAYLMAQLEYRHVFFNNVDINVVHLAWLRSIGGALSTGVATLSHCDDYGGMFAKDSFYGQVGYGLTGHLRLLGVTPQFIRIDVSVPLVRRSTTCLGNTFPNYLAEQQGLDDVSRLLAPVSFNVTFVQPF